MYILKLLLVAFLYGVIGYNLEEQNITPKKLSYWLIIISVFSLQMIAFLLR